MQRFRAWVHFVLLAAGIFVGILIVISIVTYLGIRFTGIEDIAFSPEQDDFSGNLADYLNFLIGIPVAIVGAIVAAFVATSTYDVGARQERFARLNFLLDRFDRMNYAWTHSASLLSDYSDLGGDFFSLIANGFEKAQASAGRVNIVEVAEELSGSVEGKKAIQNLQEVSKRLEIVFNEEILPDHFGYRAVTFGESVESEKRSLKVIRESLHTLGADTSMFSNRFETSLVDLIGSLKFLVSRTEAIDAATAWPLLPSRTDKIEQIGAMLLSVDELANTHVATTLERAREATGVGYVHNVGLAVIVDLYRAMPSEAAFLRFLEQEVDPVFTSSNLRTSALARPRSLRSMLPAKLYEQVDRFSREPWRMIYKVDFSRFGAHDCATPLTSLDEIKPAGSTTPLGATASLANGLKPRLWRTSPASSSLNDGQKKPVIKQPGTLNLRSDDPHRIEPQLIKRKLSG